MATATGLKSSGNLGVQPAAKVTSSLAPTLSKVWTNQLSQAFTAHVLLPLPAVGLCHKGQLGSLGVEGTPWEQKGLQPCHLCCGFLSLFS